MALAPVVEDFVRVRARLWLVEDQRQAGQHLIALKLACIDDDAQGETAHIVWNAELDAERLGEEGWESVARSSTDDPAVFAGYLRTLRWNTATAADKDLFQAPFRAGIRLDAYQLLPLGKALRLACVNLLIADDVGAGKTIEAGLVMRELLLRRRIDYILVAAPAGMVRQWQDELEGQALPRPTREGLGQAPSGEVPRRRRCMEFFQRFRRVPPILSRRTPRSETA